MKGIKLGNPGWFATIALATSTMLCAAQQSGAAAPPHANRSYTASDVGPAGDWKPTPAFLNQIYAVCDKTAKNYDQCFMAHMSKAGAPPEAVQATRLIYKTLGEVALVTDFKTAGPVDIARVEFPLRATDNAGLLLVNGEPKVLDANNLKKLDHGQMESSPQFQAVKQRDANADVWPGDRSGTMWPVVTQLPDGGIEIVIGYPILNGCQTCAHVGLALFGWDFDANGRIREDEI